MPRLSIDHLNRKREQLHSQSGGRNYAKHDRMVSAATERAWAEAAAEYAPATMQSRFDGGNQCE